ncbi:HTH-type transcriptional regulator BetI [Halioglobus japonicus]|nr:HTH-type transcriptional regulator BetI [Halioglobus japonicus]
MTDLNRDSEEKQKSYHHGNLRDALIIAAAELIEDNASVDFAMIDAARRAGVSSAAPYRHFKDKDALLEAVSQMAFLGLTENTRKVGQLHPVGSEAGIIALGKAYIDFVTKHHAFYDLMWGDMGLRAFEAADIELKTSGFYILVDIVHQWCDDNQVSEYDARELAVKLWAMAHGLACMTMNHQLERFLPNVDVCSLLESSTYTFLEGLKHPPRA